MCIWVLKSMVINHSLSICTWWMPRNLDSAFFQCPVLDSLLSFSVNFLFILSLGRCFANWKKSSTKCQSLWKIEVTNPSFNDLAVSSQHLLILFAVLSIHLFISLPVLSQTQHPEGVLSSCGCSLTLTFTTSISICHGAGATKSWLHCATLKKSFALNQ